MSGLKEEIIIIGSYSDVKTITEELIDSVLIRAVLFNDSKNKLTKRNYKYFNENNINIINRIEEIDNLSPGAILMISNEIPIPANYIEKYLFINIQFSLLPEYRGPDSLIWSLINGEEKCGFTIHKVIDNFNTGPIYFQSELYIGERDNNKILKSRIMLSLISHIKEVIINILKNKYPAVPQNESKAKFVTKIKSENCKINWEKSSWNVYNFIRALTPPMMPGAYTFYKGEKITIVESEIYQTPPYESISGQIVYILEEKGVLIKCGDNVLLIKKLIFQEKEFAAYEFFNSVGEQLA